MRVPAFCSACGHSLGTVTQWPISCPACPAQHFRNPTPVAVCMVEVRNDEDQSLGMIGIKRAIAPAIGGLALPGGYADWAENAAQAGSRELREETGIDLDPCRFELVDSAISTDGGHLLLFLRGPHISEQVFAGAKPSEECLEVTILDRDSLLAFPLHGQQMTLELARYEQRAAARTENGCGLVRSMMPYSKMK
jgi:ADP-ribose pyrophosphatase YjhB (NUDIX family)